MLRFRIPSAFPFIFRDLCWNIPAKEKVIYLTFDDGPTEDATPFVLDVLKEYNAKATFFCVGANVERNDELYQRILNEGHSVGNHSYSHLNGWSTHSSEYVKDVKECSRLVASGMFRPPFGKISYSQFRKLSREYTIVLWDVITHDYDPLLDKELSLSKSIKASRPGSVVVFHDSLKAKENLEFLLPRFLKHFDEHGYSFRPLTDEICKSAVS